MCDVIMKLTYPIILLFSALATFPVSAERSLVCQSELATGFFLEEGQWEESSFSLAEFSLAFNDNFKKLMVLGEGSLGFTCSSYYNGRVTAAKKRTNDALNALTKALHNINKQNYVKNRLACTSCKDRFGTCEFYQTEYCP